MACLLLYAFDCKDNFWQLYGDFLPSADECTSLLLATEVRAMYDYCYVNTLYDLINIHGLLFISFTSFQFNIVSNLGLTFC